MSKAQNVKIEENQSDFSGPMSVYLALSNFDRDPVEISKILGVQPSRAANSKSWKLFSDLKGEFNLNKHLNFLLDEVGDLRRINQIVTPENRRIQVVLNLKPGETRPILALTVETMARLVSSQLSIDFDYYAWSGKS